MRHSRTVPGCFSQRDPRGGRHDGTAPARWTANSINQGKLVELRTEDLPGGVKAVFLTGRMDIAGTQEVDQRFSALTATNKALVAVDLSGVSFLASIGIRTIVSSARARANRGGSMALVKPQPLVEQTLLAAGIDTVVPIWPDLDDAVRGLQAATS
jgi:anti-anti-sigma factor